MTRLLFLKSLAVFAFSSLVLAVNANDYVIAGSAYNVSDGKLLYRELYTNLDIEKNVTVDYTTPQGDVFATKKLSYKGELFQPEFELNDTRDDELLYARFEGPRLVVGHSLKYSRQEKIIIDNAKVVIDSGYDAFIQLNWDKLLKGSRLTFPYLIPTQLGTEIMEARKIKAIESPLYDKEIGREWLYVRIKPTKKITAIFSDPIYLAYDPRGRYLMRYQGRSLIDDKNNVPWYVRIDYQYVN